MARPIDLAQAREQRRAREVQDQQEELLSVLDDLRDRARAGELLAFAATVEFKGREDRPLGMVLGRYRTDLHRALGAIAVLQHRVASMTDEDGD